MRSIVIIAHNLRSTHNIGSLLRTADGLGVQRVYLTGYTPYPLSESDSRLPHIARKLHAQISKTALGAEASQDWQEVPDVVSLIAQLRSDGYTICALEQAPDSQPLPDYQAPEKIAVLLGREVEGLEPEVIALVDSVLEIPMFGSKESFNVIQAAAMALFYLRFM